MGGSLQKFFWSFVATFVPPLASLATAPLLARGLGVVGRGEVAASTAPWMFATAVGAFGLPEAVTYFAARHPHAARRIHQHGLLLVAVTAVAAAAAVHVLAGPLSSGNERLESLIQISAWACVPLLLLRVPQAVLTGYQLWRVLATGQLVVSVVRLASVVLLFATDTLTPLTATLSVVLTPLVALLLYIPKSRAVLRDADGTRTEASVQPEWRDVAGYGLRVWLGALSGIVLTRMSQVLMVPLSDEVHAGIFAIAVTIGELPLLVSSAVRDVIFAADAADLDSSNLEQVARITTFVTFLAGAGIGLTLPFVVPWAFGTEFTPSVVVAYLVIAATVLGSTGSVAGAGLGARGRPGLRSWSMMWGALANLTVLIVMVPWVGAAGGGWAMLAGNTIAGSLNVVWLHRRFGYDWRQFYGLRRRDVVAMRSAGRKITKRSTKQEAT
ncbi:polysaccharide biosynthesis protein [Janibacter hoylei PVAS-1]|uniref:Polysaccharide biosynthesis protein n=1 Tax=Janibacter hoylei PVAS-1 TaxID=1210046 RepID=K1E949_9MICO|nr:oligosaccharide flippase family protein [Janibacter hoylei]EKA61957.1 polysaccharide biosynthesis protein [Janibacter hoylei PVAS-1]RWU84480.1 teichoic acid transporter [Janibacter hoylei PVAS-1]